MEKTIYEISYNGRFTVRMMSEGEPMEEIEFDQAALEAVLADIALRMKGRRDGIGETEAVWKRVCTQVGLALQNTELAQDSEPDPLDTLKRVADRLKG
ncbi:hypothetical protein GE107_05455 [Cohnella sp. CFH 77786]|uniref:hypothetical protein n=1 Tax=Cohnella sp. CFH 77786 TaxID=2662265 RepID=UPI001C608582|nr:hypothetical protein [Cohnella sp. CFH 77786]MBW5445508.1 hypothetical protein [Cohnella sp. CFH 77786]